MPGSVACFNAMLSHCATTKDVKGAEACMEGSLQHFEGSGTAKVQVQSKEELNK
jgi:hypothetical protein